WHADSACVRFFDGTSIPAGIVRQLNPPTPAESADMPKQPLPPPEPPDAWRAPHNFRPHIAAPRHGGLPRRGYDPQHSGLRWIFDEQFPACATPPGRGDTYARSPGTAQRLRRRTD